MAGLAVFTWSALLFFTSAAVALLGLNLAFGAMTNALVATVPGDNVGEATGINSLARTLGNALGSQLTGVIVAGGFAAGATGVLPAFAAAFLGSTQIRNGQFNVWGTVLAVYVLAIGVKGLQLAGAPIWLPDMFNGVALAVAVGMARWRRRPRSAAWRRRVLQPRGGS